MDSAADEYLAARQRPARCGEWATVAPRVSYQNASEVAAKFDHAALVSAMDRRRTERAMSWRQVATEIGMRASSLSRIVSGATPNMSSFVALVEWLGLPADDFIIRERESIRFELVADQIIRSDPRISPFLSETQKNHLRLAFDEILKAVANHSPEDPGKLA